MFQKFDISDRTSPTSALLPASELIHFANIDHKDKWLGFFVQFLIWWTSWTLIDSVPELLGFSTSPASPGIRWYFCTLLLGGVLYRIYMVGGTVSSFSIKVKSLSGLILICYGLWGTFDMLAEYLSGLIYVKPILLRSMLLIFCMLFMHRRHDLIDNMLWHPARIRLLYLHTMFFNYMKVDYTKHC